MANLLNPYVFYGLLTRDLLGLVVIGYVLTWAVGSLDWAMAVVIPVIVFGTAAANAWTRHPGPRHQGNS